MVSQVDPEWAEIAQRLVPLPASGGVFTVCDVGSTGGKLAPPCNGTASGELNALGSGRGIALGSGRTLSACRGRRVVRVARGSGDPQRFHRPRDGAGHHPAHEPVEPGQQPLLDLHRRRPSRPRARRFHSKVPRCDQGLRPGPSLRPAERLPPSLQRQEALHVNSNSSRRFSSRLKPFPEL